MTTTFPPGLTFTIEEKRRMCDTPVTLNGRPAVICGTQLPYPEVRSLDGQLRGEWAWATVARIIVLSNGRFYL